MTTRLFTLVLVIAQGACVLGLTCHSCSLASSNEICNVNSETCDPILGQNACYNEVQRLLSRGKVYTKGCMSNDECLIRESLNSDKYCPYQSSKCTYCCFEDNCNAFNTAPGKITEVGGLINVMTLMTVMMYAFC